MDENKYAYDALIKGVQGYVNQALQNINRDITTTGIIKKVYNDVLYDVAINGKIYYRVKSIGGTCELNENVNVLIKQGDYKNMIILKGGAGGSSSGGAVQSVNGKIGVVTLTASDVGALPDTTVIPTKTSELTNDSEFVTKTETDGYYVSKNGDTVYGDLTVEGNFYDKAGNVYLDKVTNPDSEIVGEVVVLAEYVEGYLVDSADDGGLVEQEGYIADKVYIPITADTYTYVSQITSTVKIVGYDSDKKMVEGWNQGYNHAYRANGDTVKIPSSVAYIRYSINVSPVPTGTLPFDIQNSKGVSVISTSTGGTKTKFTKVQLKDGYNITTSEIDDETMHQLMINRDGSNEEEFNIVSIKAPELKPLEATLSLLTNGTDTSGATQRQFMDLSSMKYHSSRTGTIEIVCQCRGDTPLPYFWVNFNDGKGAGRVHKFGVHPDSIPIELTSTGLKVRKNNDYNNTGTDDEYITMNLVDLYNEVYSEITEEMINEWYGTSGESSTVGTPQVYTTLAETEVGVPTIYE